MIGSDPHAGAPREERALGRDRVLRPARRTSGARKSRRARDGRGADVVLVAVPLPQLVTDALAMARPGGRVLLFAQNDPLMKIEFPAAAVGVEEKEILGSYSAAIDRAGGVSAR